MATRRHLSTLATMTDTQDLWPQCTSDVRQALDAAPRIKLEAGAYAFHSGASCNHYLLALAGTLRIQLAAASGREVTLYRVKTGDSCILTTSCLISGEHYPAEAIVESDVTALAIDKRQFQQLLDSSSSFRQLVFGNFSSRLADVIRRMEAVVFTPIDPRLAALLLEAGRRGSLQSITHQSIAVELGTAREVASRHLKRFEQQGLIHLGRGHIAITDEAGLLRLLDPPR
jgi:CRP/FNR family transcriptional regulator, anaerobic regulatory protein